MKDHANMFDRVANATKEFMDNTGINKKFLIGVSHSNKEELDTIIYAIDKIPFYSFKFNLALELREDYKDRMEKTGLSTFFFSDIANTFSKKGWTVSPLEDPKLHDYSSFIELVKGVKSGRINLEDIRQEYCGMIVDLAKVNDGFCDPRSLEMHKNRAKAHISIYKDAIDFLGKNPSDEEVGRLFGESNARREAYMLGKIRGCNPDIVVVGIGHTKKLCDQLKDYTHISYPYEDNALDKLIPQFAKK